MAKRHATIGIKQAIRLEWMQKTVNLLLAGLDAREIRSELHLHLSKQSEDSETVEGSKRTRTFLVGNLMRIWVTPETDLLEYRDASLSCLRELPRFSLPIHWAMVSSAYPFWFNVARQTGRLLALQDRVTQQQIINRVKEQYGDRQTISRYAQYVIRSFVAWGVLVDTEAKGCYAKQPPRQIDLAEVAATVLESALNAEPVPKLALSFVQGNPAFFPFHFTPLTGTRISQLNKRIDVSRYGIDDELLMLNSCESSRNNQT